MHYEILVSWLNVRKVMKKIRRDISEEDTVTSLSDDATTRSIRGSDSEDFGYFYERDIAPYEPNYPRVF